MKCDLIAFLYRSPDRKTKGREGERRFTIGRERDRVR